MRFPVPRSPQAERARTPLWLWPVVTSLAAFVLAVLTVRLHEENVRPPFWLRWQGDADSAATLLQAVAGSVITVTGLTFSLTVVALQLASQQFSPRMLREFAHDPGIKRVLSVLVAAFVFTTVALRYIRSERPAPDLTMFLASLLSLAALGAVLYFITHIAQLLRVDTMMLTVHDQTDRVIDKFHPEYGDESLRSPGATPPGGTVLPARRSGFVRMLRINALLRAAAAHGLTIEVAVRAGDHVVRGSPVATVWWRSPHGRAPDPAAVDRAVQDGIEIGYERTNEQDVALGLRQLADIAVKALSPAVNDPVTAAHAVGHLADLLVRLTGRRLGPVVHGDGRDGGQVIVRDRDLAYYLELACGQIRRYGRHEPAALNALLRMLRDVAAVARDDSQRDQIALQAGLIRAQLDRGLLPHDIDQVEDMFRRVHAALDGDLPSAYGDRSGETRSL
ncbi:DUF2254 domain-containing protein [Actinocorallia populi]|uniref:DUF2254 domain-containing protein n=1 Tax=Actinocorallia populi TaxID=2079200 RepID=UPI000D091E13|nr:DUF2254 domain-containing protein [Actinocorallia populi]